MVVAAATSLMVMDVGTFSLNFYPLFKLEGVSAEFYLECRGHWKSHSSHSCRNETGLPRFRVALHDVAVALAQRRREPNSSSFYSVIYGNCAIHHLHSFQKTCGNQNSMRWNSEGCTRENGPPFFITLWPAKLTY